MNKKLLIFISIMVLGGQPLYALTKFQVAERAAVAASLVSGAVYWMSSPSLCKLECPLERKDDSSCGYAISKNAENPLKNSAVTFLVSYPLFAWLASYYTADARYKWAIGTFRDLDENYLYRVRITGLNLDMVLQESGCESKEFPLVEAFIKLQSYDQALVSIADELEKAIKDTSSSELRKKLRELLDRVRTDLPRIRNNEAVVKNNDKTAWLKQWKLHQRRELEREKMRHYYAAHVVPLVPHTHVVYHR